ncbi:MAG: hypothetical protein ACX98W_20535 [bacterium]
MAATVQIRELNGAGETATDKTSGTVRFKNADDATVDLNNPLVIPTSGREYSFEKFLRLYIAGGTFTQISNLRAYTDGAPNFQAGSPTEVDVFYTTSGSYRAPVVPSESAAIPQSDLAGSPLENMSQLFAATSGSPIDLDATNSGPWTPGSPVEANIGDYLSMVMRVLPGATQGVLTGETLTFAWDEI